MFRPERIEDVAGKRNKRCASALLTLLETTARGGGDGRAVVISGPHGSGKTSTVGMCMSQLNFTTTEVSAGCNNNDLSSLINKIHTFSRAGLDFEGLATTTPCRAVIVEDAECFVGNAERMAQLHRACRDLKGLRTVVVCIFDHPSHPAIREANTAVCHHLQFDEVHTNGMKQLLGRIVKTFPNVGFSGTVVRDLLTTVNGDARQLMVWAELYSGSGEACGAECTDRCAVNVHWENNAQELLTCASITAVSAIHARDPRMAISIMHEHAFNRFDWRREHEKVFDDEPAATQLVLHLDDICAADVMSRKVPEADYVFCASMVTRLANAAVPRPRFPRILTAPSDPRLKSSALRGSWIGVLEPSPAPAKARGGKRQKRGAA